MQCVAPCMRVRHRQSHLQTISSYAHNNVRPPSAPDATARPFIKVTSTARHLPREKCEGRPRESADEKEDGPAAQ